MLVNTTNEVLLTVNSFLLDHIMDWIKFDSFKDMLPFLALTP